MKLRLATIAVLLFATVTAFAQEWRLEIGTGMQPIHMGWTGVSPSSILKSRLTDKGQYINTNVGFYPNAFISGVCRYSRRWEMVLTAEVSWSHHRLMQFAQFGIDPNGKPRFDRSKSSDLGWKDSSPIASGTLQWRYLWIPDGVVNLYSGFGLGFSGGTDIYPVPSVTPLGIRAGGKHIYGFIEAPFGPYASFVAGGLGWSF